MQVVADYDIGHFRIRVAIRQAPGENLSCSGLEDYLPRRALYLRVPGTANISVTADQGEYSFDGRRFRTTSRPRRSAKKLAERGGVSQVVVEQTVPGAGGFDRPVACRAAAPRRFITPFGVADRPIKPGDSKKNMTRSTRSRTSRRLPLSPRARGGYGRTSFPRGICSEGVHHNEELVPASSRLTLPSRLIKPYSPPGASTGRWPQ